jgi:hypothetical protein
VVRVVFPVSQGAGVDRCVYSTTGADDAISLPSTQPPSPTSVHELSELAFIIYTIEHLTVNQAVLEGGLWAAGKRPY